MSLSSKLSWSAQWGTDRFNEDLWEAVASLLTNHSSSKDLDPTYCVDVVSGLNVVGV